MAVVMALFLKHFVVEAYKIPTGSMQPTLMGDERADVRDRILVDKLSYVARAPRRWEVAVFRYPLDRSKSFVKRIAGVGPEELKIEHGDVWRRAEGEAWSVARRPPSVQREAWKRLDRMDAEESHWVERDLALSSRWTMTGRAIVARGPGTAAFRGGREAIVDGYFDGYPEEIVPWMPAAEGESGNNPVGDLRLEGTLRALPGCESVTVVLREGARHYRFELPGPAAPAGAVARIDAGPYALAAAGDDLPAELPYRLPAGERVRFAAENLDDRLALELDGEPVLACAVQPAEDQNSALFVTLAGEGADLEELMPYRDIYYTARTSEPVHVPAGSYFMLGDNTQDSSDSREWTYAVFELHGPTAADARVQGNWRERENPRSVAHGDAQGPLTYFVDEWGEPHWFRQDQAVRAAPRPAPFVPRAMILGKALAVFWPLDPGRDIWRLKWVH